MAKKVINNKIKSATKQWSHSGDDISLEDFLIKLMRVEVEHLSQSSVSVAAIFNLNKENIIKHYSDEERKANGGEANIALIKSGTKLDIPVIWIEEMSEIFKLNIQPLISHEKYKPFAPFVGDKMANLIEDENYFPSLNVSTKSGGGLEKRLINVSVYVYSRVLDSLINVSPFVTDCNTSNAEGGGNFSFGLSPITVRYDADGDLVALNEHPLIKLFDDKGVVNYYFKDVMSRLGDYAPTSVDFTLNIPNEKQVFIQREADLNSKRIRNKTYWEASIQPQDMVFIKFEKLKIEDENGVRVEDPFATLNIRDLNDGVWDMMALVDSVSTAYAPATAGLTTTISGRDFSKLILEDGAYFFPATNQNKGYGSNYFANVSEKEKTERPFVRLLGEIQDINLFINKPLSYTMSFIFNKLSTIEVFDDSLFNGIAEPNEVDSQRFYRSLSEIPSLSEKKKTESKQNPKSLDQRVGIYKLIEIVIDDSVANKTIVDSSIATNSGSIMNFIGRICQNPFVEFFTDTYNDRFYWIVRKPPFTKESFANNYRIGISDENIINSTLSQSDGNAYSWYRLVPIRAYFGDTELAKFAFPAQFFPEFAKIFGSRPLEVTSNYVEFGDSTDQSYQNAFFGAVEELRFIIESNAYLPFTTSGTITIHGDRRFKKGMNVYVESTDELFYIDSVSNTYTVSDKGVDRITTLAVSRGIIFKHIDKYFDLIRYAEPTVDSAKERRLNYKVNTDIFDFLIKKKQYNEA